MIQQGLQYAQCMRSHGVTNFRDAGEITRNMGIDPNSPTFQSGLERVQEPAAGPRWKLRAR